MRAARRSAVAAVASRDGARAVTYARDWSIPIAHPTYDALLRDGSIDAVYIPLPNSLHVEWTLRALDAGKHVLCEKPLALKAEDVDRVEVVARARERVVAEAFMYRHEPLFARVLELVRHDAIGPLRSINAGFTFPRNRANDIRVNPALGGGSLWDIGCYPVSAAIAIADAPVFSAFGFAVIGAEGVDEWFAGLLRFRHNVVATISSGFTTAYRTWLEVTGADGTLQAANPFKPGPSEQITLRRGDSVETITVDGSPLLFVRQIDDFVGAALDGREPAVTLRDSRDIAAALSALYRSVELQQPVQL